MRDENWAQTVVQFKIPGLNDRDFSSMARCQKLGNLIIKKIQYRRWNRKTWPILYVNPSTERAIFRISVSTRVDSVHSSHGWWCNVTRGSSHYFIDERLKQCKRYINGTYLDSDEVTHQLFHLYKMTSRQTDNQSAVPMATEEELFQALQQQGFLVDPANVSSCFLCGTIAFLGELFMLMRLWIRWRRKRKKKKTDGKQKRNGSKRWTTSLPISPRSAHKIVSNSSN